MTIVGLGLAYGTKENLALVFIFLPIALMGVFLCGTLHYHKLFWLGGYKRAVEEKISLGGLLFAGKLWFKSDADV